MVEDRQSLTACFSDKEAFPSLGWPISHPTGDQPHILQTATACRLEATPSVPRFSAEAPPWESAPRGATSV